MQKPEEADDVLQPGGCRKVLFWTVLAGALSLILSGLVAVYLMARIPAEIRQMADDLASRFNHALHFTPEIRVDGLVVVEGSRPALEVVTSRTTLHSRYKWSHTFLYSTKKLEVAAPFTASYGFSLDEPFRVRIEPQSKAVDIDLPPTSLIALEMGDIEFVADSDGLWNQLTPEDREKAIQQLRQLAADKANSASEINNARGQTEEVLRELSK